MCADGYHCQSCTSVARFSFLRSPPDKTATRLSAHRSKPTALKIRSPDPIKRTPRNWHINCKCSRTVKPSDTISNCVTNADRRIISERSTGRPPMLIVPSIRAELRAGQRKRCDTAASRLVLPAPLGPRTAISWPDRALPLTFEE